jgi:hypothetical protein
VRDQEGAVTSVVTVCAYPDGDDLVRMRRPRDWDWARFCQVCERKIGSVYSRVEGGTRQVGWRAVCGRRCFDVLRERGDA